MNFHVMRNYNNQFLFLILQFTFLFTPLAGTFMQSDSYKSNYYIGFCEGNIIMRMKDSWSVKVHFSQQHKQYQSLLVLQWITALNMCMHTFLQTGQNSHLHINSTVSLRKPKATKARTKVNTMTKKQIMLTHGDEDIFISSDGTISLLVY